MRSVILAACASVIIASACTDSKPATESALEKPRPVQAEPKVTPSDLLFDSKGDLVESNEVVAGLRLPRGVRLIHKAERRYTYETTRVPQEKIQKYFGRRLFTGAVEQKGQRVVYRAAVPKGIKGGIVKLDVGIQPMSAGRVHIDIKELRPMPKQPLSDQQVQSLLKEQQKYMQ
jgi:hypothetical protein